MSLDMVEKIANAVLYEGYMLYPYRPSSVKNRQRFTFGVLVPETYSVAQSNTEAWSMQTECLITGNSCATLDIKLRFIHLFVREIWELMQPAQKWQDALITESHLVRSLEVNGQVFQTWQEAVEREVEKLNINLNELISQSRKLDFSFPTEKSCKPLHGSNDNIVGMIIREQASIHGVIEVAAERVGDNLYKIRVGIFNVTPLEDATQKSRDQALIYSFASAHTILRVRNGEFVSLLEPPEEFTGLIASCQNKGTWPVMVGKDNERNLMLSSPIILYDYPQIAPESPGDLFDSTEIDEILTLRIMTMTDEEKREMRFVDDRARKLLERTETMSSEQIMKLHGALRGMGRIQGSHNE